MGSWLLPKRQDTQQTQPMTALRIQSSVQGKPIPIGWGCTRLAANVIWYGDFVATTVVDGSSSQGGKGGAVTGGGGKGQQGSISYTYSVSAAFGLCQGTVNDFLRVWANKAVASTTGSAGFGGRNDGQNLGFEKFDGNQAMTPWGYLLSVHPDQALNYRGLAYVAQSSIDLGSSTELPNYSFEVYFQICNDLPGLPDANARDVIADYLTNPFYGVPGWPANRLAPMTQYATYCKALGLAVSPVETDAREASAFLADLLTATNAGARWSGGKLDVIPWGDTDVTGNGVTYIAQVAPIYDLVNDDFLPMSAGASGDQPITSTRKPPNERLNSIRLSYLDRQNNYDPDIVEDKDQASIQQYGARPSDVRQAHVFALTAAARLSAHLQLVREQIPNTYMFSLSAKYILLDVEDIVTLTRPELALLRQAVRITEITENDDGSLTFDAEEFLGTARAPLYGVQATAGFAPNTNVDPGGIHDPLLFEPTDELGGGLQVWAAVCGLNRQIWGGCNVFASYDDITYVHLDRMVGPSRMGVLSAPLAAVPANPIGQTIDTTNTLSVDISECGGQLQSGTQADALALNTACYVDGEVIAYQTATLTGPSAYNLNYLVRGVFGTETSIVPHAAGSKFARLDSNILQVPYDQSRIGSTIYLKFQSFNVWGGGLQDISTLPAYRYTLTGSALASPLPPVTNVRTVFEAGFTKIWWEEINDFRSGIRYIIRKGDSFAGGQDLGTLAHPPFIAFGAGTYWIMPTCQPIANLIVFGETAVSLTIQGNMLTANIVQTTDFKALGWPGYFTNVGKEGSDPNAILRLVGTADILSDPNVLVNPDIINAGEIATNGMFEGASSTILNVGYVADCFVNITWQSAGIPIGADILTDPDFLNNPDVLNAAGGAFIDVWIEIRFATTATGDMFQDADMFTPPDMFNAGIQWSEWQRYVPGVYRAQFIQYRAVFTTIDVKIIAYLLSFLVQVSIPARIDHYLGNSVPGGVGASATIIFEPDDAIAAKPFNGGPLVGGTFNHPLPQITMDWPGHAGTNFVIDALSLSQVTFHIEDAIGNHIAVTNVDVVAEGY